MICAHCKNYKKGYCSVKHKTVGYLQKFPCFEAVVEDDLVLLPEEEMNKPIFDTTKTTRHMETKVCKTCGRELPIEDFATFKGKPTSICKDCKRDAAIRGGKGRSKAPVITYTEPKAEVKAEVKEEQRLIVVTKKVKTEKLTWEDVQRIVDIADAMIESISKKDLLSMGQAGYYTMVLNKWRNESAE